MRDCSSLVPPPAACPLENGELPAVLPLLGASPAGGGQGHPDARSGPRLSWVTVGSLFKARNRYTVYVTTLRRSVMHLSLKKLFLGTSLVAQWLRIHLPMQGTRVRALVWEDPTCRGAAKPVRHNY